MATGGAAAVQTVVQVNYHPARYRTAVLKTAAHGRSSVRPQLRPRRGVVSVLVSFTPVRRRSPANADCRSAQVRYTRGL